MIEYEATAQCDLPSCGRKEPMLMRGGGPTTAPIWGLPDGWVQLDQGLGIQGGFGTFPIPGSVDLVCMGRVYCSALHVAEDLAGQLDEKLRMMDEDGGS